MFNCEDPFIYVFKLNLDLFQMILFHHIAADECNFLLRDLITTYSLYKNVMALPTYKQIISFFFWNPGLKSALIHTLTRINNEQYTANCN